MSTTIATTASGLPAEFQDLEPFAAWILDTQDARYEKRLASTVDEMQAFYDVMFPRLQDVIDYCNQYDIDDLAVCAAFTRAGLSGALRMRTPVASNTALARAAACAGGGGGGSSGSLPPPPITPLASAGPAGQPPANADDRLDASTADAQSTHWLFPRYRVELFRDDAEGYFLNLNSPGPCFWVFWRADEARLLARGVGLDGAAVGCPQRQQVDEHGLVVALPVGERVVRSAVTALFDRARMPDAGGVVGPREGVVSGRPVHDDCVCVASRAVCCGS